MARSSGPKPKPAAKPSGAKGFRSKAEWRYYFANPRLRALAHKRAHATKGGKGVRYDRLPERKSARAAA